MTLRDTRVELKAMKRRTYAAGSLLLVLIAGCAASEAVEAPESHFVTGRVTMDGEPLKGAIVKFVPTGSTRGDECMGQTDDTGLYTVKQFRGHEGAQSGKFLVVIEHHVKPDGSPMLPGEAPRDVGAIQILPPKYSSLSATTLKADVPEGGGEFSFELSGK